jgi:hypothetical protein
MAMYIQYFCTKLFSGAGAIGSPCGVSGGGVRRTGLSSRQHKAEMHTDKECTAVVDEVM